MSDRMSPNRAESFSLRFRAPPNVPHRDIGEKGERGRKRVSCW